MLVAKTDTKERMQDGTSRIVPAGSPFLNPATSNFPLIGYWANNVTEKTEAYDLAMSKIPKKDLKYLNGIEKPAINNVSSETELNTNNEGNNDTSENRENEQTDDSNKTESVGEDENSNDSEYTKDELNEMSEDTLKSILKDNEITFGYNSKKETLINKILTSL